MACGKRTSREKEVASSAAISSSPASSNSLALKTKKSSYTTYRDLISSPPKREKEPTPLTPLVSKVPIALIVDKQTTFLTSLSKKPQWAKGPTPFAPLVAKDHTGFSVDKRIPKKPQKDSESTSGVPRLTDYIKQIDAPKAKVSESNTGEMPKILSGKNPSLSGKNS